MNRERMIQITEDALLGQAVGDAFGVPVEFCSREEVRAMDLREMIGSDSGLNLNTRWGTLIPAGSWSDDTSMTVASMASFVRCGGRIDASDQMKQFIQWWDRGEYCCLKAPFGLGGNISDALERFRMGAPAQECGGKGFMANGNGALMRILPFSLYCIFRDLGEDETVTAAGNGSALTHGHEISRMCCFIWTEFLRSLVNGSGVRDAVNHIENIPYEKWFSKETLEALRFVSEKKVCELTQQDIGQTGYVADTLYAALCSMMHADGFEGSIRNAVNLGYDTDTTGAVTGMAAGILYGLDDIPESWMKTLRKKEYLKTAADAFAACLY